LTPLNCSDCGTELGPSALACPACHALVHANDLRQRAADAERAERDGDLPSAREQWTAALALLPADTHQSAAIQQHLESIVRRIHETAPDTATGEREGRPWWWKQLAAAGGVALLLVGKLKFLLLGLTKLTTVASMFAFFAVYWSTYGWPLALGLVVSIYVHEMGHVSMLRSLGIQSAAPIFIPGVGALVMLKQHIADPIVNAKIGLAGPVWGLGAALGALAMYGATGAHIWLAIAKLTGFINLFNLIPVWQLDGSRGLHALTRRDRWILVAVIAAAFMVTGVGLLVIVGAVAAWRAMERETGPGDSLVLTTFVVLVGALSLLASGI